MIAIETFDEFYTPYTSNTLHDNPDGEFLMALVTSGRLNTMVTDRFGDDIVRMPGGWLQMACHAAAVCSYIKCLYGGPANWACVICSTISLACALAFFAY